MLFVYQRFLGLIISKIFFCGFYWKCEKFLKYFLSCLEKKKKIFIERMQLFFLLWFIYFWGKSCNKKIFYRLLVVLGFVWFWWQDFGVRSLLGESGIIFGKKGKGCWFQCIFLEEVVLVYFQYSVLVLLDTFFEIFFE